MLGPLLTAAIAACSPQPNGSDKNISGKETVVRPAGPAAVNAPSRPFFAVNKIESPLLPASNSLGRLTIENGCIIFVSGAGKSLPIWPSGSTLRWDGRVWVISFKGRSLQVETDVGLPGGTFSLQNRSEVRIDGRIPSTCPNNTYAVARA